MPSLLSSRFAFHFKFLYDGQKQQKGHERNEEIIMSMIQKTLNQNNPIIRDGEYEHVGKLGRNDWENHG